MHLNKSLFPMYFRKVWFLYDSKFGVRIYDYCDSPDTLREETDCAICFVAVITDTSFGEILPESGLFGDEPFDPPRENLTPPG